MRLNETPTRLLAMVDSVRMLSLDDNRWNSLDLRRIHAWRDLDKVLTVNNYRNPVC
jgi:hypothetical protein